MTKDGLRTCARVGALLAVAMIATFAVAQNTNTGEIRGTVTDTSGAMLSGVKITITNVETGVSTVTSTNSAGVYDVPSVPIGDYKITFAKDGFRELIRQGITLQLQTLGIDAVLQVGAISEQVTVTAENPLVETETSDQHVDLNTVSVQNAPIVGNDWRAELTQLIPGVNAGGGTGEASGQQVGVNGTQSYNVNFLIDGSAGIAPEITTAATTTCRSTQSARSASIPEMRQPSTATASPQSTSSPRAAPISSTVAPTSTFRIPPSTPEVSITRRE